MLIHNADITGSLLVNGTGYNTGSFSGSFTGIVAGTTATASYVEYNSVANKPALVSGSSQITYSGLTGIPSGIVSGSAQVTYSGLTGVPSGIVSGSAQITYSGLTGVPAGIVSGSAQVAYSGLTGIPSGIVSGSAQIASFGIFATTGSNGFNGSQSITGSLTVTGQVVAQTLNVQQVTSSIVYSSGSNIFGNTLGNTQQFTGSVSVTGSLTSNGALTGTSGTFSGTLDVTNTIRTDGANNSILLRNGYTAVIKNPNNNTRDLQIEGDGVTAIFKGNGLVGIGTTSPINKLSVNISDSNIYSSTSTGNALTLYNTSSITNGFVGIDFISEPASGNAGRAAINMTVTGNGTGDLAFSTRNSTMGECMRITSGGNVGIGTTGPATFLHVAGTSAKTLTGLFHTCIQDFTTMAAGVGGGITFMGYKIAQSNQEAFAGIDGFKENGTSGDASGAFRILTQPSSGAGLVEKMRITSGGNVGIGVTPVAKLHVEGTIYSNIRSNTIDTDDGVSNNFQGYGGYWALRTDLTNRFNLDVYNSGTPITALQLSLAGDATFSKSVTATDGFFLPSANVAGVRYLVAGENTNTGTTGRVMVLLQNSANSLIIEKLSTGFTSSGVRTQAGSAIYDDGAGGMSIGATNASGTLRLFAGNSERARITADGLTFNGDTAAANALDDYEEGTWTPTWSSSGGTINTNSTFTTGRYTKIGNVVHIWARLYTNSVSSPTGEVTVSGLPFTVGSQDGNKAMHLFTMNAITGTLTGTPTIAFNTSNTTATIYNKIWNSSEFSGDIATYFDNDTWGYFYGTYTV